MTEISKMKTEELKRRLSISQVLKHYGGECINLTSGSWWCIMHESGGKKTGHKTPSLVAKDNIGTATCMSQRCFEADDIFSVIAKMEHLDLKDNFTKIKSVACDIAGISYNTNNHYNNNTFIKDLTEKHLQYLQSIGISKDTALLFGLKSRDNYILYPQLEEKVIKGYKGISITKNEQGKSKQFFENYTASIFHTLNIETGRHIIFTEGEKDCLRLTEAFKKEKGGEQFLAITITTGAKSVPQDILKKLLPLKPVKISILYDNDLPGREGSKKLAEILVEEFNIIDILYFSEATKVSYDLTDFLNEGNSFNEIFLLKKETLEKKQRTLLSSYPQYLITQHAILDTLTPDKILYSGYKEIDEKCPLIQGENTIIVGRTGKGKTVLGVNFVNGLLKNNKDLKMIVFSLELKKKSFLQRLLSAEYNIETWKIKKGFLTEANTIFSSQKEQYLSNANAYIKAYENQLMIVDDIHSIESIDKLLDDLKNHLNFIPNYILIDYANILSLRNLVDSTKHIQISTWMKFLAKEKNIHVQAICQANRATKENDDGYARTENLADSDQYGRDAFIVYSIKTTMESNIYSINPTKNRNGKPEEEIELVWNGKTGKISSSINNENEI